MGQKSINDIYTVFHALSHGIGGKYSFFQEDGELTRYHHRYIGQTQQHDETPITLSIPNTL